MSHKFLTNDETLETQFRSIYLLGANTATYKFALAQSLLDLNITEQTFISLDDLTPLFAKHLLRHIQTEKRQISGSVTGKLLNTLQLYHHGQINEALMLNVVRVEGFKYVLDAFHRLPAKKQATPFFHKDLHQKQQGIILTDELFHLFNSQEIGNFREEIEGRWHLVESAWSEKGVIEIQYDIDTEELFYLKPVSNNSFMHSHLRTDLTAVRKPLNGYQKGRCFYCYCPISIESNQPNTCDVDHLIPMSIQYESRYDLQLNNPWNLVLACKTCNRWESGGKAGNMPVKKFIDALYKRNEYFIESAHPLRENIILKTGNTPFKRQDFLLKRFEFAGQTHPPKWMPKNILGNEF